MNGKRKKRGKEANSESSKHSPKELLAQASTLMEQSDFEAALKLATSAIALLKRQLDGSEESLLNCLPALNTLGEINVELGELGAAIEYFKQAADIDEEGSVPDEKGGGPDKFLWLAQLDPNGGNESVQWFKKGIIVLRQQVQDLTQAQSAEGTTDLLEEKKTKLANALCAVAEIYMTDLSHGEDAEMQCDAAVHEALALVPQNPDTLQTAASVRISQERKDEARQLLSRSLALWKDRGQNGPESKVPEFASRISLSRLLMEVKLEHEALDVLEELVAEDESSVEAWYLGGWCLYLLFYKQEDEQGKTQPEAIALLKKSRSWLRQCLAFYSVVGYEDEKLHEHAIELLQDTKKIFTEHGVSDDESAEGVDGADSSEEWEDEDEDMSSAEEMEEELAN